jgi:hypothetical protein
MLHARAQARVCVRALHVRIRVGGQREFEGTLLPSGSFSRVDLSRLLIWQRVRVPLALYSGQTGATLHNTLRTQPLSLCRISACLGTLAYSIVPLVRMVLNGTHW